MRGTGPAIMIPETPAHTRGKLYQYQCQKEGSLFYYQWDSSNTPPPSHIIGHCPVCGSKRVKPTGRTFPSVDENARIAEGQE